MSNKEEQLDCKPYPETLKNNTKKEKWNKMQKAYNRTKSKQRNRNPAKQSKFQQTLLLDFKKYY